jgi:asparagine synthase (glutamine-hydrolysing)
MCGIAGQFNYKSSARVREADLRRMARRMAHRGPDGEGFHTDGAVGFAHKRLAIIDLEGGYQPMTSADGSLVIVYNGEVFNYLELFDELKKLGFHPRTKSDTEAVLLAYQAFGLEFPKKLNGMFAIAIWDTKKQRLVCVRDRMGVKPFYYAMTPDGVVFASELKALRGTPGVDTSLDRDAFDDFMTMGYVVNPRSIVRGVKKLEPGAIMVFEREKEPHKHLFWRLQFIPDESKSGKTWEEEIRALFDDSVKLRLRSDVPLGVLLSGGVDSSAIAATVARNAGGSAGVDSFCTGVDVPGAINEFEWARQMAERIGTRHHELKLSAEENGALLIESAALLDEPLAEPMVAQLLAVCRLARKYVTVVLSGEGSDETWFGYYAYRTMYAIELAQKLMPKAALAELGPLVEKIATTLPVSAKLAKHMRNLAEPLERRYLGLNYFDPTLKQRMYAPAVREEFAHKDARESMRKLYDGAGGPEVISQMAAVDCRGWLVDNTLLRSDLMSMAASVELRVPFLDYRLVELASRVPAKFKVRPNDQKAILKKALADRIPREIATRRKIGFPTPLKPLFKSAWGKQAEAAIMNPTKSSEGLFDLDFVRQMFADHREGKNDYSMPLAQLLMFEYWAKNADELDRPSNDAGS